MMQYAVIGSRDADNDLAYLWIHATDRDAVTAAQHQIDTELARDPHHAGSELSEGLWRIKVAPLKAFYEIDDQAGIVRITRIDRVR
jgi:hypothetical protein